MSRITVNAHGPTAHIMSEGGSVAIGLAIMPLGCLSCAAGLLLMKSATDMHPTLPPWRSPRWLLGFLLLGVLATVVDVIVLGMLPLSVVAPFADM